MGRKTEMIKDVCSSFKMEYLKAENWVRKLKFDILASAPTQLNSLHPCPNTDMSLLKAYTPTQLYQERPCTLLLHRYPPVPRYSISKKLTYPFILLWAILKYPGPFQNSSFPSAMLQPPGYSSPGLNALLLASSLACLFLRCLYSAIRNTRVTSNFVMSMQTRTPKPHHALDEEFLWTVITGVFLVNAQFNVHPMSLMHL